MESNGRAVAVFRGSSRVWLIGLLVLLGAVVYVGKAWTPSSYSIVLNMLGQGPVAPALGTPRGVRTDEFFVQTPYFQMAVRSGLGAKETVSPYGESLKNFMAFPTKDWSVIFKPALWGFLFLPPANAYSFYFCLLSLSCLAGWFFFLRELQVPPAIAIAGAIALLFSHFFQVWWTTNAPAFAFAPWVGVAFLAPRREWLRGLALFFTLGVWGFSLLYPPFIYAIGAAMAFSILALRRDAVRARSLATAGVAAIACVLMIYFYMHEIIDVMRHTVYPGQRSLYGGTTPWVQVLSTIAPYLNIINFDPTLLAPQARNECEVGALSSYLLILLVCFAVPSSIREFRISHRSAITVVGVGLAVMCAWMILPIPASVGHLLLLDKVPPNRLVVGFGLLLHLFLFYMAGHLRFAVTARRVFIFIIVTVGLMIVRKWHLPNGTLRHSWFDLVAPILIIVAYLLMRWHSIRSLAPAAALVGVAALTNMLTFGTFNPLQSAKPFFRDYTTGTIGQLREQQAKDGLIVLPRWYGAALNGLGIRAINDTLISPQRGFFAEKFPDMDAERANDVFNRYGHVIPEFVEAPYSSGDQIHVPVQSFLKGNGLTLVDTVAVPEASGNVSSYSVLRTKAGAYQVEIAGWSNLGEPSVSASVRYNAPAWKALGLIREPRPDVADAYSDPGLALSGFRAYWSASSAVFPSGLQLMVLDGGRQLKAIPGLLGLSVLDQVPTMAPPVRDTGFVDVDTFDRTERVLRIQGWLPFEPRGGQELRIRLPGGVMTNASLVRSERPDVSARFGDGWRYAGFELTVTIEGNTTLDPTAICLLAYDPSLGVLQLNQHGRTSCPPSL
ncbi:hypothetical protein P5Y53_17015 [Dyella jiangningensis]|uniref:DUF7657 domain-containing protein n=1 Tax=Dyella jiangningensis TaxID=1379159 RepID=UPI0024109760|nr:hypothetical protein [Dyella jiangningensis]MDG2539381.1 hypothetical protein [Dyella jiangningensis]